jgi:hypothetical protein
LKGYSNHSSLKREVIILLNLKQHKVIIDYFCNFSNSFLVKTFSIKKEKKIEHIPVSLRILVVWYLFNFQIEKYVCLKISSIKFFGDT